MFDLLALKTHFKFLSEESKICKSTWIVLKIIEEFAYVAVTL